MIVLPPATQAADDAYADLLTVRALHVPDRYGRDGRWDLHRRESR